MAKWKKKTSPLEETSSQISDSEPDSDQSALSGSLLNADKITLNEIAPAASIKWNEEKSAAHFYRTLPSNNVRVWQAKKGASLKTVLEQWGAKENIAIAWETNQKYKIDQDTFISGTFENAIDVLLSKGLKNAPAYKLSETPYHLQIGTND